MAWYRRRRYSGFTRGRTYRRFGGSSRFYRAARSSNRQFAAARAQRDIARFTLKYASAISISVPVGQVSGVAILDTGTVLRQTPQYSAFSSMFDQVKMNGCRLKMTPRFSVATPSTFQAESRPVIAYAWDRNGAVPSGNLSFDAIRSYGSATTKSMSPGMSNSVFSSIYATDIMERTLYSPTSQLTGQSGETITARPFLPDFLFGVQLPANAAAVSTFAWDVELTFDLTFRGVRFNA